MLNLKKLLTKMLNSILALQNIKTATVASGLSGEVKYVHFGRVCVFSGYVNTAGALTVGQQLVSGLPAYYTVYANAAIYATNNNSTTENIPLMLTGAGNITSRLAQASANRQLRFTGAYLTSAVGGVIHKLLSSITADLRKGVTACA